MKIYLLLIVVFFSSLSSLKAQKLDIIPKPVKMEQQIGVFLIPSEVQIIVDKKIKNSASYISTTFRKNTGIATKIAIGKKHPKNGIQFLVDDKLNIPNDGYTLTIEKTGVIIKGKSSKLKGFVEHPENISEGILILNDGFEVELKEK